MFDRILFPTDGSETAGVAWAYALELADRFDGELDIALVIDQYYLFLEDPEVSFDEWTEVKRTVREDVGRRLDALVEEATDREIRAERQILEERNPSEAILSHADERGTDAIVLGTHGRSGVKRFLLGSVAERIARHAGRPVVLVPRDGN